MSAQSTVVIYHRADFDGIFCREIAKWALGRAGAEYIGWDYGDPVPLIGDNITSIYILDLSVPELMLDPRVVWIDHHKSAIERYPASIPGWRLDGVAACRLTWRWFFGPQSSRGVTPRESFVLRRVPEPMAVTLAGEYDIWDKHDPQTDMFQMGLRGAEVDFSKLLRDDLAYFDEIVQRGKALLYAQQEADQWTMRELAYTVEWAGLRWLAVNSGRASSDLFKSGLRPGIHGCIAFVWCGRKGKWKVSLRGVPEYPTLDLSMIAAANGGGGHKQACGFECDALPFTLEAQS